MGSYSVVFIRGDDQYPSLVRELGEDLLGKKLLPFVGAGISRAKPSCLAMSPQLSEPLREAMRAAARLIPTLPADWGNAERHLRDAPLERILDVLQRTHGAVAIQYLSVLNGDVWNPNHSRLASFAAAGLLPILVTLNFDLLFEKAVAAYGCSSLTRCPLIGRSFYYGAGPQVLTIIKPHGSFSPRVADPYEHRSATLSQVGTEPSTLNEKALAGVLEAGQSLLVAGYSDNDWDIFPLLARLVPRTAKRGVWVKHGEREKDGGEYLPGWESERGLPERIIPWLRTEAPSAVLLVGDVRELLEDVADYLNARAHAAIRFLYPTKKVQDPPHADNAPFLPGPSPTSDRTLRTLVSLAMLITSTGPFSDRLLEHLRDKGRDACPLDVAWQLEETLSNAEHNRGAIRRSILHMRRVLAIKSRTPGVNPDGHDYVWLGYKYLCRVKRWEPGEVRIGWLVHFPLNLGLGLWFLWRGARRPPSFKAGHGLNVATARDMARYYRIDLLHTWASIFLLWGSEARFIYRTPFRVITHLYGRLAKMTELLDHEYYYLRHLEARLFSGADIHDIEDVRWRLDELERSYRLTQNDVQLGNAYAYRALILFLIDGEREAARKQLDQAEEVWKQGGRLMASGKRRVKLFRRFVG